MSLALSKLLGAQCLFNDRSLNYCKFKFGLDSMPVGAQAGIPEAFESIFQAYIPNDEIIPEYGYYQIKNKKQCDACKLLSNCEDKYLIELENNVKTVIASRNHDEIQELKSVINQIVQKRDDSDGLLLADDIRKDFEKTEAKLRKRIQLIYPKVKRWANLTTIISAGALAGGIITNNPALTVVGGVTGGLSKVSSEWIKYQTSKHNWIGFKNKHMPIKTQDN
jgi:hypothetical protein